MQLISATNRVKVDKGNASTSLNEIV